MKRKNKLPLAQMEVILKSMGAQRVSNNAKKALSEYLEQHAEEIGKKAILLCLHAGRKTVNATDIRFAVRNT